MLFEKDIQRIEPSSPLYPKAWKALSDAETLYAVGNAELLRTPAFTVVGSRRTPANALRVGEEISKTLSGVYTIVTGTADGGDSAAMAGALKGSGKVICVLAGGFSAVPQGNLPLLKEVAKRGLLISPHSPETEVRAYSYERRNKLLALLGEGTLVLGAAEKSGALITAKYTFEEEKPVFALPYSVGVAAGKGCNALIKSGAYLAESAEDIADKMKITLTPKAQTVALTADEEKMFSALAELSEAHVTELSAKSGVPAFKARAVLSSLEVKGLVVSVGGNCYASAAYK